MAEQQNQQQSHANTMNNEEGRAEGGRVSAHEQGRDERGHFAGKQDDKMGR